jgi:hypothetical protein
VPQGICLGKQKSPFLVRAPGWQEVGPFLKMLRGIQVTQSGHGDAAPHPAVSCCTQQTLIGRRLGLLRELLGLVCCGDFHLLGLAQQLISLVELAGLYGGVGALDELTRDRVLGIECRQPIPCPSVSFGNLGQLLRQQFERNILLADNAQHCDGCALGHPEPVAQFDDPVCKRTYSAAAAAFASSCTCSGLSP